MITSFQRIGVVAQLRHPRVIDSLNRLVAFLKNDGRTVIVDKETANVLTDSSVEVLAPEEISKGTLDLVIVVGGDGSMLGAARSLLAFDVPMLGLNRGRLGFLTDISPEHMETGIGQVLAGNYQVSERCLLELNVHRDGKSIASGLAFNDVVLHPGRAVRMMEFELYIDGSFVYSQRSDGLIVSTPTGSTAYALSAGGPIMCPELDALVLVPMNPHTLSSRPIVVSGDSELEVRVGPFNELHPKATCDGQYQIAAEPGDAIRIRKHPHTARLIHPQDHDFYEVCRRKLGWGSRLDSDRE